VIIVADAFPSVASQQLGRGRDAEVVEMGNLHA
jgi:hypothetical protein